MTITEDMSEEGRVEFFSVCWFGSWERLLPPVWAGSGLVKLGEALIGYVPHIKPLWV